MTNTDTQTQVRTRYLVKAKTDKTKKWGATVTADTVDDAVDQARTIWNRLIDGSEYVDIRIERRQQRSDNSYD